MSPPQLILAFFFFFLLSLSLPLSVEGGSIGVNYGRIANNLPSAAKVVSLLTSNGFNRVKVFDSDPAVLRALGGSGIRVTVDLPNQLLRSAATSSSFAHTWILRNVAAYYPRTQIEAIAVGNEVFVDPANSTKYLLPAMENLQAALRKTGLHNAIKISSPIALSALKSSYPPSSGSFRSELVDSVFRPMLDFLRKTGSYLMVNAYPFLAYEANSDVIPLDYALFRPNPGQLDSGNGLRYFSLFDAQIDAVFAAMSALNYHDVPITVTETGWPSNGDPNESGAGLQNAATYNGNLVRRVLTGGGTPLRPTANLTVLIFALFNENMKPGPTSERNFGLFYPTEEKVYNIPFTRSELDRTPTETRGGVSVAAAQPGHGQSWCVANGEIAEEKLQAALDYACGEGSADCRQIQPGATCYNPNTLQAHASYAFNSFYQKSKRAMGSCDFHGAAFVVSHPPRYGNCDFPTE